MVQLIRGPRGMHPVIVKKRVVHDDIVYFTPTKLNLFESNPFIKEERRLPVEFNHPYNISNTIRIETPENYELVELPKSLKWEAIGGQLSYQISYFEQNGNIVLKDVLKVKENIYSPSYYTSLKNFFVEYLNAQNIQIVYKKKQI